MKVAAKIRQESRGFYLVICVIACVGVYLRLDQFSLQVLLDDEWHVIHQLMSRTPAELFFTFGASDFSIPLALLYWSQSQLFGLSEIGMRWPMMLAGVSLLILFPLYTRKYFGSKATLIFLLLLAISPLLILFSRTARPYSLTLLLSYIAVAAFYRFYDSEKSSLKAGFAYVICAVVCVWLHLVSLPLVVAPFLVLGITALRTRNWNKLRRMLYLGLITLTGLLLVVLPPLLAHPEALAGKLGAQLPNFRTYYGALYVWLGTSSLGVVLAGLVFAVLGFGPLVRKLPMSVSLMAGLCLTLLVILLTEPAWAGNPATFARYLLAVIPMLLLSMALGISRLSDTLMAHRGFPGLVSGWILIASVFLLMGYFSPLPDILARPNSNSLHAAYQSDFRKDHNVVSLYQKDFPVSPFWQRLAAIPRDSLKIAAAPFSFETHHWDAARWEQISGQRVMPGYITGFCTSFWWGEVPKNDSYRFKNVGYLSDRMDLIARGFDLIVFQRPFIVLTNQGEKEFGMNTAGCEDELREQYPSPVYEDKWLLVFPLSDSVRDLINATQ